MFANEKPNSNTTHISGYIGMEIHTHTKENLFCISTRTNHTLSDRFQLCLHGRPSYYWNGHEGYVMHLDMSKNPKRNALFFFNHLWELH